MRTQHILTEMWFAKPCVCVNEHVCVHCTYRCGWLCSICPFPCPFGCASVCLCACNVNGWVSCVCMWAWGASLAGGPTALWSLQPAEEKFWQNTVTPRAHAHTCTHARTPKHRFHYSQFESCNCLRCAHINTFTFNLADGKHHRHKTQ